MNNFAENQPNSFEILEDGSVKRYIPSELQVSSIRSLTESPDALPTVGSGLTPVERRAQLRVNREPQGEMEHNFWISELSIFSRERAGQNPEEVTLKDFTSAGGIWLRNDVANFVNANVGLNGATLEDIQEFRNKLKTVPIEDLGGSSLAVYTETLSALASLENKERAKRNPYADSDDSVSRNSRIEAADNSTSNKYSHGKRYPLSGGFGED